MSLIRQVQNTRSENRKDHKEKQINSVTIKDFHVPLSITDQTSVWKISHDTAGRCKSTNMTQWTLTDHPTPPQKSPRSRRDNRTLAKTDHIWGHNTSPSKCKRPYVSQGVLSDVEVT